MNKKNIILISTIFILLSIGVYAAWTGNLNSKIVYYYSLNESTGTEALESVSFDKNITGLVNNWTAGIIGNGHFGSGADQGVTNINLSQFGNPFSMNFWANRTGSITTTGANSRLFDADGSVTDILIRSSTTTGLDSRFNGSSFDPLLLVQHRWYMVTFTRNSSGISMYVNGTLNSSLTLPNHVFLGNPFCVFNGGGSCTAENPMSNIVLDEVGFWNRTLTEQDISDLYNSGAGSSYNPALATPGDITIQLNSPSNNSNSISNPAPFNATLVPENSTLTNATFYLWNSTGFITNLTTIEVTGVNNNDSIFNISDIPIGAFTWNVLGCSNNDTGGAVCKFAPNNLSFDFGIIINSSTFDLTAFETDQELFQFNITKVSEILSLSAILNYNGTENVATVDCNGNNCTLTSEIDINLVSGGVNESKDFFFQTTLFTADTSFIKNLTIGTQNVSRIFFDVCNSTLSDVALNFTVFDEQDGTRINPFYIAGEFDSWLGTGNVKRPLSFSNLTAEELGLCINPAHRTFNIDDTIEYNDVINSTTYNTRNYYFQNDQITNIARHIPLFLLNVDDSTTFILKVQDTNLLPIPEAIIEIQRLDVGTGNFSIVQIAKTDDNGQTVGFFKTETVDYRFNISRNGLPLLLTGPGKVVPETAPFTLTFTIGEDEGSPWQRFEDLADLTSSLLFNSTSSITSFAYEDVSGNFTSSRLIVALQNLSGASQTICDVASVQSAAILTCDINNVGGTYTASGLIIRGTDNFLVEQIIFKVENFSQTAGLLGVFLAWFVILVSAFAFKFNEIAGIVLMNITVIAVNIIGLVNFGFLFVFGMMGVSILLIILLEK